MLKMDQFCAQFFYSQHENYGTLIQILPEISFLEAKLKEASGIYNDSSNGNHRGVGFYFHYQGKWDTSMLSNWEVLSSKFISVLKQAIYRPVRKRGTTDNNSFYRVPMRITKIHVFLSHVSQFR